jgi:hypothetical protein
MLAARSRSEGILNMGEFWQMRGVGFRESMMMALAICGAARGTEAAAADTPQKFELPPSQVAGPLLAHPLLDTHPPLDASFSTAPMPVLPEPYSSSEFRPRRSGGLEFSAGRNDTRFSDMPHLQDSSVARQMSESKSQDRLRLLTLWQSRASSLSLQAGKRGAPSLQWSIPLVHRDGGPRGLFDRMLSVSPHGAFGGARNISARQPSGISPPKSLELGSAAKP